jgi:alpha-tubulin suppressor-like RCC1 family protein
VANWIQVAGGTSCTFALDQLGRIFSCGDKTFLQLGLGNVGAQGLLRSIPFPSGVARWTAVSGGNGTLAISDTGNFLLWFALEQVGVLAIGDGEALLSYAKGIANELRGQMV